MREENCKKMSNLVQSIKIRGKEYPLGYKVVTEDMKSLGLRKNPNIIQFELGKWVYLKENEIEKSKNDWGGIWVARTLSNAKKLGEYMIKQHQQPTKIFKATLDEILYFNSYRIKTNGVKLFEEILD